uniref:Nuclear pore complex protein Nup153 n=1 Tax=Leptobrachium leishanense TaxID=445787 RepID=A0A8C5PI66_9ANUR
MAAPGGGGFGGVDGAGGTGTGGKIRSRRYHQSLVRAPYSRGRPQPGQQGIIGRVTDTVKNIVPGWLQKYFNKETSASDRVQDAPDPDSQHTEHEENTIDPGHQIYIDDDPTVDGRVTPDRVRLEEEPSTSRFSLSMPDVLTRPSLHRANLNFNLLDSPALHCQPSTSSAFPNSSSGFSLVKEIKDSTSQHDDDNISTTSGFSSRASDKDVAVPRNVNAPPLWSPEADRSNTLSHNSSSAKKPAFNLSTFGALSPAPLRLQVKAKPANNETRGVISYAARRILQSLDKMSSPLADAKKIPSISSLYPSERILLDNSEISTKKRKVDSPYPPSRGLVTPKSILVSPKVSSYIKPSLTQSGLVNASRRRLQSGQVKEPKRNLASEAPQTASPPESFSYPMSSTPAANGLTSRGGGKMMRERNAHYTTKPVEDVLEEPVLPDVPLPLCIASLPSFNFSISTAASPVIAAKPTDGKTANLTNTQFTFSSPIVKSTESNAQSPGSSVGFTFSAPAVKVWSQPNTADNKVSATSSPAKSLLNNLGAKKEEEYEGFCKPAKTLKEGSVLDILKGPGFSSSSPTTNSLGKSKSPLTKPASKVAAGESNKHAIGIWQCDACFLENRASVNKCAACSTSKDKPAGPLKRPSSSEQSGIQKSPAPAPVFQGFGEKFKVAAGTWECDTCLVQNKPDVSKCVACDTPKPGAEPKSVLLMPPVTKSAVTPQFGLSASFQFDDKFKRPVGSWECTVCCVQNKAEDVKCIACASEKSGSSPSQNKSLASEPPKTTGLLDQFKKPSGSWDCDVCLVQNQANASKCIACESAKPGSKPELKGFAAPALSTGSTAPSFMFGLPASISTGEQKLGISTESTPATNAPVIGFSFPKVAGDFKFGVPSFATKATDEKKDAGLFSGGTVASSNPVPTGFQFGKSFAASANKEVADKSATIIGVSLGMTPSTVAPATKENSAGSGLQNQLLKDKSSLTVPFGTKELGEKKDEAPIAGFSFGKIEQTKDAASTSFVFGKKDEQTDSTTTGAPSLLFGKKSEGDQPKPFVFGKPEQTKDSSSTPATFAFGVSNPAEKDADQIGKPGFSFGSQPATTATESGASKQTFSFLTSDTSSGSQNSSAVSSTPVNSTNVFSSAAPMTTPTVSSGLFGNPTPSGTPSNSGNVFGNTGPSGAQSGPGSLFGSIVPTSTASSSTSVFGSAGALNAATSSALFSSTTPASATSSTSMFGSAAPANSSCTSVFGNTAPASTSSIVFGGTASVNTSANSSNLFGNSGTAVNPTGPFLFGQSSTTTSGSVFGAPAESKSSFVFSASENKPVTATSTAASATPFVFGASSTSTVSATPSFNFGAANTSNTAGTNASPFIFGNSAPSAPTGLPASNPVPAFGQGATQSTTPAFGASASTSLFPTGTQSATGFGSVSSSVQPPMFGQQATQPNFGSSAAPPAGSSFQFGNTNPNSNFGFATGGSSGVFTFGSNSVGTAAQSTAPSGFTFNQPPAFNLGTNGRNAPASSISTRKIKTARRRK